MYKDGERVRTAVVLALRSFAPGGDDLLSHRFRDRTSQVKISSTFVHPRRRDSKADKAPPLLGAIISKDSIYVNFLLLFFSPQLYFALVFSAWFHIQGIAGRILTLVFRSESKQCALLYPSEIRSVKHSSNNFLLPLYLQLGVPGRGSNLEGASGIN